MAARSLARKGLVSLKPETVAMASVPIRARHELNPAQQAAFEQIRDAILTRQFRTFLLHGVTGSGKTEVYLTAIEAVLAQGRSALLLVPEIALTPAMAGQFFLRFGDRVAILHSAFTDVERTEQWRRIRSGKASVVVGTRSGVFAPMRDLGLIVVDEEHDGSYKQKRRRATTGAMWPWCGRSKPARAWCWVRPRPPSKAATTWSAASIRCWNCRAASRNGPCRWSN